MGLAVLVSLIAIAGAGIGALLSVPGAILSYYRQERRGQGETQIRRRRS